MPLGSGAAAGVCAAGSGAAGATVGAATGAAIALGMGMGTAVAVNGMGVVASAIDAGRLDQHLSSADGVDDGRAADLGEPGPRATLSAFIKIGVTVDDVAGHQPAFFPSAPCPYAGFEAVRLGVHPHGEHQAAPRHRAKVVVFCTGSQGAAVSASAHLFPSLGQ